MPRLTPEEILKNIEEEKQEVPNRGELKIFLGYAAGVGKTYHMLDIASEMRKKGRDIVVGYVERHDRKETLDLLEGFEIIAPKIVKHKGIALNEFDLQATLLRSPELVIVDELAHTNAQGSKNEKRYQDVEELLNSGIDVYTTLNIQHIKSLKETVRKITDITVKEVVPDEIIKKASNIELIDIEPEELIHRIQSGKVYKQDKIETATNHFFTIENLTKLREIALQYMVDSVDRKNISISLRDEMLVCLGLPYENVRMIEKTYRFANFLHCKWTVMSIPPKDEIDKVQIERIEKQFLLIKKLEGKFVQVSSRKIVKEIKNYIKEHEISRLIISRNMVLKKWLTCYFLLKSLKKVDIYIV